MKLSDRTGRHAMMRIQAQRRPPPRAGKDAICPACLRRYRRRVQAQFEAEMLHRHNPETRYPAGYE